MGFSRLASASLKLVYGPNLKWESTTFKMVTVASYVKRALRQISNTLDAHMGFPSDFTLWKKPIEDSPCFHHLRFRSSIGHTYFEMTSVVAILDDLGFCCKMTSVVAILDDLGFCCKIPPPICILIFCSQPFCDYSNSVTGNQTETKFKQIKDFFFKLNEKTIHESILLLCLVSLKQNECKNECKNYIRRFDVNKYKYAHTQNT